MMWSRSPSCTGRREKPAMATAPITSSGGVSTSRASISIRGRMMSRTVRSPSRRARRATICSAGSSTPCRVPVRIKCSMSSTETDVSRLRRPPKQPKHEAACSVPSARRPAGRRLGSRASAGPPRRPSAPALARANCLGTSSPKTTERNVMPQTRPPPGRASRGARQQASGHLGQPVRQPADERRPAEDRGQRGRPASCPPAR